ncbi:MAG: hypothetical protein GC136_00870 [Alphaproteobacteria bacterium]|nr:hypothetical protein [Alphaproteobacteria bacterium]
MRLDILAKVSMIALFASFPALAAEKAVENNTHTTVQAKSTGDFSKDAEKAWEDVKGASAEAYNDVKAFFMGDNEKQDKNIVISTRYTADGMLGAAVKNNSGERVGTVKDIIVDRSGKAQLVVIDDGEFPGFSGKLVAFDYDVISAKTADGDVIAPLTEESINRATEFSYDRADAGKEKVRVIPVDGYSVMKLVDADVVNPAGEEIGELEDISFRNGKINQIFAEMDVPGDDDKMIALNFGSTKIVGTDNDLNIQLNAGQAARFTADNKVSNRAH